MFVVVSLGCAIAQYIRSDRRYKHVFVMLLCAAAVLSPWYIRNHQVAGVYALSGAGWRNVYTDYLSSLRSLQNGTPYHEEKNKLKEEALPRFGITREEVDNPKNGAIFRKASLEEMWQNKSAVVRLETALLASFFLNDGYYYEFRMLGFVQDSDGPHISPTYTLLSEGLRGLPKIFDELARQKFIPLLGRAFTGVVLLTALVGFFLSRSSMRYAYALAIVLSALAATAIGLGLDARMRFPMEPLLFLFSAVALVRMYDHVKMRYAR